MKVLVLGCAGFIGRSLSLALIEDGYQVWGIDSFDSTLYDSQQRRMLMRSLDHPKFKFIEADAREFGLEDILGDVEVVFNLAAVPGLTPSWEGFSRYLQSNTDLVHKLLEALIRFPDVLLVQASTSSVYGAYANGNSSLTPNSPYGVSKLAAEQLIKCYEKEFSVKNVILRYFSVYGPNPRPDQFFSILMEKLASNETITIHGKGTNSRSHAYVEDVVGATIAAARIKPEGEILDVSGSEVKSTLEIVDLVSREMGIKPKLFFGEKRPGDQIETKGNLERTKELLDWAPKTSIERGIQKMVRQRIS